MSRLISSYAYSGITDKELSFESEQEFELLDNTNDDWWFVKGSTGEGYVPASYMRTHDLETDIDVEDEDAIYRVPNSLPKTILDEDEDNSIIHNQRERLPTLTEAKVEEKQTENQKLRIEIAASPKSPSEQPTFVTSNHDTESDASRSDDETDDSEETDDEDKLEETAGQIKQLLLKKRRSIRPRIKLHVPIQTHKLPQGFRSSSLARSIEYGQGLATQFLTPEIDSSGLAMRGLNYSRTNQVRKRDAFNVSFGIVEAKNMSDPAGLIVISRMVRVALFDPTTGSLASNIHAVPVQLEESTWKVRVDGVMRRNVERTFVRTSDGGGILFEMVLVCKREGELYSPTSKPESSSMASRAGTPMVSSRAGTPTPLNALPKSIAMGETVEISCGWALLPLFTSDGKELESRMYDMQIFGGSPLEKDVALPPSYLKTNFFTNLLSPNPKSPRLHVKVYKISKAVKNQLSDLPDVFVGNLGWVAVLSMYRRILAQTLLGPGQDHAFGARYEPALALIPKFIEYGDLIRHMATLWKKKLKGMKMRDMFTSTAMTIWPLLFIDMPTFIPGHLDSTIVRLEVWNKLQSDGIVAFLSKPTHVVKQFDMKELEFDYLKNFANNVKLMS